MPDKGMHCESECKSVKSREMICMQLQRKALQLDHPPHCAFVYITHWQL